MKTNCLSDVDHQTQNRAESSIPRFYKATVPRLISRSVSMLTSARLRSERVGWWVWAEQLNNRASPH